MFICIFFNKLIVENEFIGDIIRLLDIMNFVFFFINLVLFFDEFLEIIFGLFGDIFIILLFSMNRFIDY